MEKLLGKIEVSEDLIATLRDPETPPQKAAQAFQQILLQVRDHTLKTMGYAMKGELESLTPRLQALEVQRQQAQVQEFLTTTTKKYPALRGKGPALRQALREMQESGYRPASRSDAYRTLAKQAQKIIRAYEPNFSLKSGGGQHSRSLPPRRGGGGGRGDSSPRPNWQNIWKRE